VTFRITLREAALLVGGCTTLGIGVGLMLTAGLGSDGFSTLVNGISISTGWSFAIANVLVSSAFLGMAAARRLLPGVGTVVQVLVVGYVVSVVLSLLDTPATIALRTSMMVVALPVIALGIAVYLGSGAGAGPAESAALAWDPPLPFKWSYTAVQLTGAAVGWALGAAVGPGTLLVVVLLGPSVDLTARILRLEISQHKVHERSG
jgi:uncharacterized membrane protein YczE